MKNRQKFFKPNLNTLGIDTRGKSIQLEIPDLGWGKVNSGNYKHKIISHPTSRPHTAVSILATNRNTHSNMPTIFQTHSEKLFTEHNSHNDLITIHKTMLKKSSNCSTKYNKDSSSLNLSLEPEVKKKLRPSPFFNLKAKSQQKLVSYKKKKISTIKQEKPNKDSEKIIGNCPINDLSSPEHFSNLKLAKKISKKRYFKILKSKNKPKMSSNITSPLVVSCIGKIQIN